MALSNSWGRDRFWHPHRQVMDSLVNAEASLILADVTSPHRITV